MQSSCACRNLSANSLQGGLPSNWARTGVFPNLTVLDLSSNPRLDGVVIAQWGTQGAFASLQVPRRAPRAMPRMSGRVAAAWEIASLQGLPPACARRPCLDMQGRDAERPAVSWQTVSFEFCGEHSCHVALPTAESPHSMRKFRGCARMLFQAIIWVAVRHRRR